MITIFASYLIIFAILIYAGYLLQITINKDQRTITPLLILIPQSRNKITKTHQKDDINISTELYKRLVNLKIQFTIEVVVENIGEEIKFFLFVSRQYEKKVRALIESLWADAKIPEVDYYDLFSSASTSHNTKNSKHNTLVGYLTQTKPFLNPTTTSGDSFTKILHYLASLKIIGEAASIQWIVKPAHSKIKFDISKYINQLTTNKIPTTQINPHLSLTKDNVQLLEEKISHPLLATNCRIVIHTSSPEKTQEIMDKVSRIFATSHNGEHLNQLRLQLAKNQTQALDELLNHQFTPENEMILNTQELATLFHLPGQNTSISKIKRQ